MTETKAKRDVRAASNTFTREEISVTLDVIRCVRRGGDARVMLRSDGIMRLERKFTTMLGKIDANRGET